ncbi:M28 family peptidase [Candidatus Parcubacteria bacterium]|nr:MAG: M28 family peptidase [Candidatus Parcubacteria bacterium]
MKNFFKNNLLLFVVFVTGAAVLVVEVVAVRILSPYFGSTIFTVSSVMGVILAALSLGYYFGGKLADKYPSERLFFSIIFISGASVLLLQLLSLLILPILGYGLSITTGPLISAVVLFFIPAFLLGTLSPLVIRLQKDRLPDKGIGGISGQVFFWSTLGSIFGSLFTGFVLIPNFGINEIVLTTGAILLLLGIIPIFFMAGSKKFFFKLIVLIVLIAVVLFASQIFKPDQNIIYEKDGLYEKLFIYDDTYEGRPARFFVQDRSNSGAMFLDGDDLLFKYTKYYSLYKIFVPEAKEVLAIGGGIYSVPKKLLEELPEANIDVSEIEPELEELAKKYFALPESPRLKTYTEDGRRYLVDTDKKYDLVFSDVYFSIYSVPMHFTTQEFYQIAKSKLNQNGIFVANFIGSLSRQKPSLLFSEIKTFESVFDNTYYFAVNGPDNLDMQNIIFVGVNGDKKIDFTASEITGNQDPIIQNLASRVVDLNRFDLSDYPVLTDNYAPVEYLTAQSLSRNLRQKEMLFDGQEIMSLIDQQLDYGPRYLSSSGHEKLKNFLIANANSLADEVLLQSWQHTDKNGKNFPLTNIIARFNPDKENRIILGTHYDSKKFAHNDADDPSQPVPGANDSASSTAVLLELMRQFSLNQGAFEVGVDIIFFDGEEGEEWIVDEYDAWSPLGSKYFVQNLSEFYPKTPPTSAIILDMVCDSDLLIQPEASSIANAPKLVDSFWKIARETSPENFSLSPTNTIIDDHTILQQAGIDSIVLIDFTYPYFHTTKDTLDKCSPESLESVATAVFDYIYEL